MKDGSWKLQGTYDEWKEGRKCNAADLSNAYAFKLDGQSCLFLEVDIGKLCETFPDCWVDFNEAGRMQIGGIGPQNIIKFWDQEAVLQ